MRTRSQTVRVPSQEWQIRLLASVATAYFLNQGGHIRRGKFSGIDQIYTGIKVTDAVSLFRSIMVIDEASQQMRAQ